MTTISLLNLSSRDMGSWKRQAVGRGLGVAGGWMGTALAGWACPHQPPSCTGLRQLIEECMAKMPQMIENWRGSSRHAGRRHKQTRSGGPAAGGGPGAPGIPVDPRSAQLPGAAAGLGEAASQAPPRRRNKRKKKESASCCDGRCCGQDPTDSETPNS